MGILDGLIQRSKMKLHEFISLNSIFVGVDVDSKKNVFKTVANFFRKKKSLSYLKKLLKNLMKEKGLEQCTHWKRCSNSPHKN